ncbi:unnamed protein product [Phytomonas sp. Hart1]|nr:unnamed protein product [Phytomonas sp. Hart1]|eukprot:CCW66792.1 unnamed protein product [Phytomonas sp. isolate Hart1]
MASALHEADEDDDAPSSALNSDEVCELVRKELAPGGGNGLIVNSKTGEASERPTPATAKEKVANSITAVLPIARPLAETIYKTWMLHNDGRSNLFNIAAPSDYVLDVKLLAFVNLHPSSSPPPNDQGVLKGGDGSSAPEIPPGPVNLSTSTSQTANEPEPSLGEAVHVQAINPGPVQTDTTSTTTHVLALRNPQIDDSAADSVRRLEGPASSPKRFHRLRARMQKWGSVLFSTRKGSSVEKKDPTPQTIAAAIHELDHESPPKGVTICISGSKFSNIPSTARACVLLTLDTVVPPGRYTSDYDWYYRRIVGFESESERIMVARVFSQNSPTLLVYFFDFLKRMLIGKELEFVLNRGICKKLSIPEDASKYIPAMRKLMFMYMDTSRRWILSDLTPLSPTNYKVVVEK